MKYWEIIADKLSKAGWSLGWVSAIDSEGRTLWIVMHTAIMEKDLSFGQMKCCQHSSSLRESRTN